MTLKVKLKREGGISLLLDLALDLLNLPMVQEQLTLTLGAMIFSIPVTVYRDLDLDEKDGIWIPIIGLPLGAGMCGIGYFFLK